MNPYQLYLDSLPLGSEAHSSFEAYLEDTFYKYINKVNAKKFTSKLKRGGKDRFLNRKRGY